MIDARLLDAVGSLVAAHARPDHIPLIGVAGAQGSGKTTLARAAAERLGAACLSLDDVYLTRARREAKSRAVHPLFAVRGPPGTHDLALLEGTITALRATDPDSLTPLPAFDKLADDRRPWVDWPVFAGRPSAVLVDGWCLGATPQPEADLVAPINALEAQRDGQGIWRRAVNANLAGPYAQAFARFDAVLFLKAPSFDAVLDWRCQQEAGLMGLSPADLPPARRAALAVFIQHFERITRSMLAGGVRADVTIALDEHRRPFSP
ncbi:kinase [Brevundimonas naejangsanensis]|uniref:Kinase n=1 Tax=Brevundimonas naejangsanensis TaxID=588932 RepID=A0A494REK4_9CAUL|nr:kinase [Brevundimonas naejangsanensis]AYG94601.1 kinase [Brevundimonas naejangsanensis]